MENYFFTNSVSVQEKSDKPTVMNSSMHTWAATRSESRTLVAVYPKLIKRSPGVTSVSGLQVVQ